MSEEAIFHQLFEHAPNPEAIFDLQGRCIIANKAFSGQLGYDREAWLEGEHSFTDLFRDEEYAHELRTEILDRKVIRHRETSVRDGDDSLRPVLLSARVLEYDNTDALEVSLVNLSRQKQRQRSLWRENARMASLLEAMTAGIFLVDQNGEVDETNLALQNMLQFAEGAISGKSYQELFGRLISRAIEPEVVQQSLSRAVTAVSERPTIEVAIQDETPRYLEITLFPVWNQAGKSSGWGGLVQDVTDMRDRVSWKLELLSILAHDIRAPLASLKGHATALLGNYKQWGDEMVLDFLAAIDRSTDQLIHQVDRSLALTRVEAGRLGLKPESVDAEEIITDGLERIIANHSEAAIDLRIPDDLPEIRVDPGRMEEVLINLVDNALRYSPPGEEVVIQVNESGPMLQVSITDHGPGIPESDQDTIFEKYTQAEGETGGSGLGLFISRKIVEAHGGKLWLESPPNDLETGTRFTFSVPVMSEQIVADSSPAPTAPEKLLESQQLQLEAEEHKVLVVEDEPDFQSLIQTVLHEAGYQVEIIDNGPEAVDLLQMSPYDIILLDWNLPGMQGIEVCRNVRRWSNVPILMVTSHTSMDELITALDAGADDYITKPFKTAELLARMRAVLRRKESFIEQGKDQLSAGGILINFDSQEVWSHGKHIELTPTEFNLLAYLTRNEGQVLTYDQLLDHLYGPDEARKRHDLFVHISRLRKKLEPIPEEPRYILTRWGVGYMFKSE